MIDATCRATVVMPGTHSVLRGLYILRQTTAYDVIRALGLQGGWRVRLLDNDEPVLEPTDRIMASVRNDQDEIVLLLTETPKPATNGAAIYTEQKELCLQK